MYNDKENRDAKGQEKREAYRNARQGSFLWKKVHHLLLSIPEIVRTVSLLAGIKDKQTLFFC